MPIFKVWNAARSIRKAVQANSVSELCEKGGEKLGLQGELKVVLETDGTEIEDDSVLLDPSGPCAGKDVILVLLQSNDKFTLQSKPLPIQAMTDAVYLLSVISRHSKELRHLIEPDFGLLEELLRSGLLNEENYEIVRKKSNRYKKIDCLIHYFKLKTKEEELKGFLEALRNSDQGHVANYLLANGERLELHYGLERPLGAEEMNRLRANGPFLLSNITVTEEFLAMLLSSNCITQQHKEHIVAQKTQTQKVVELLTILRRRSVAALKNLIEALHETHQSHAADVLSVRGVAVPLHVNVSVNKSKRDIKTIENDLATRLNNFAATLSDENGDFGKREAYMAEIRDLWLELELTGIRYKCSRQGSSISVYLWCRDGRSLSNLCALRYSGNIWLLLERTLEYLVDENEEQLSFSLKIIEQEWHLAESYFQVSEKPTDFIKPSPFMKMPKELLEIVLIKSLLSFYNATWRSFPFTDFNPYKVMMSVCQEWRSLIAKRHWFRSTVKLYLAKNMIIQRNSVFDILPKEILEMILMRSLLSFVHVPWKESFPSMPQKTFTALTTVCQQWQGLLASRVWFASIMRNYLKKNKHIALLQKHHLILVQCLEVDYHFLFEMHSRNLLSEEQLFEIGGEADRLKQIDYLFLEVFLKFCAEKYAAFVKVLEATSQNHVIYYLEADGVIEPADHDERPLSDDEYARLEAAQSRLSDFIPSEEFLKALSSSDCITSNHAEGISSLPDGLKLSELFQILKRRSFAALRKFVAHLRKLDQYADVVEFLTTGSYAEPSGEKQMTEEGMELEEPEKELDSKTLEIALAEKMFEVGKNILEGEVVTLLDINQIRMLWNSLVKLVEEVPHSQEKERDECENRDKTENSNSYDCLLTEDITENEDAIQAQWIEGEDSFLINPCPQKKWSVGCGAKDFIKNDMSKMKRSQSYIRAALSNQDIINMFLRLYYEGRQAEHQQNGQTDKAATDDKKMDAEKETTATSNYVSQWDSKLRDFIDWIVKLLEAETGNPYFQSSNDNAIIYTRSYSAADISTVKTRQRKCKDWSCKRKC